MSALLDLSNSSSDWPGCGRCSLDCRNPLSRARSPRCFTQGRDVPLLRSGPLLADFGTARCIDDVTITGQRDNLGSLLYIPPEFMTRTPSTRRRTCMRPARLRSECSPACLRWERPGPWPTSSRIPARAVRRDRDVPAVVAATSAGRRRAGDPHPGARGRGIADADRPAAMRTATACRNRPVGDMP
jgi:hypothetical protein